MLILFTVWSIKQCISACIRPFFFTFCAFNSKGNCEHFFVNFREKNQLNLLVFLLRYCSSRCIVFTESRVWLPFNEPGKQRGCKTFAQFSKNSNSNCFCAESDSYMNKYTVPYAFSAHNMTLKHLSISILTIVSIIRYLSINTYTTHS